MKKGISKIGLLFLIGVPMSLIGFNQLKHPEIIIDESQMNIDDLGFGSKGKHPEIVEVTVSIDVKDDLTVDV
ncbi:hypothetical protein [Acholeplasma hippikon]|nr:hypothetical protein [Acholeplasma hippikon]